MCLACRKNRIEILCICTVTVPAAVKPNLCNPRYSERTWLYSKVAEPAGAKRGKYADEFCLLPMVGSRQGLDTIRSNKEFAVTAIPDRWWLAHRLIPQQGLRWQGIQNVSDFLKDAAHPTPENPFTPSKPRCLTLGQSAEGLYPSTLNIRKN